MKSRSPITVIFALLFLNSAVVLWAQGQDAEGKEIISIQVRGNQALSDETIVSKVKTKIGDSLSSEVLNEDLKKLYATDYFTDVSVDVKHIEGGVVVTFIVKEKPIIEEVIFEGNRVFSSNKLKSVIKSKPDEVLNYSVLAQDVSEVKKLYEKKGYSSVEIKYRLDVDEQTNKTNIYMMIDEKTRVKVSKVSIVGNEEMKANIIKRLLSTKPAWLFNPGVFQEEAFEEDLEKVKAYYQDNGFLDVKVKPQIEYSPDGRFMEITLEIKEGRKYLVGDISVKGNMVFPEKEVKDKLKLKSGDAFSERFLRRDVGNIREYYFKYGYVNVQIDVSRSLNPDTQNIDFVYIIDAKDIVYVGIIDIRGNTKTKDVVIRRELKIYPGDRFDGEKIKRSKGRLYNLGFFEDVGFDIEPTEEENVRNLVVHVKEAKTGEFSFGGGYSSIDELIGFVAVTQRNFDIAAPPTFMGGGQNLTIKAEFGTVRRDYLISWTDPWILGYPFLFGFDLYQTTHAKRAGYIYEEVRTGGDARLGKEFTDQFRGELTYRLEMVDISNVSDEASQDLKDEEGENLISSLLLQLSYDKRDNVFSPKRGYLLVGTVENAGGAFGGDKNFIKTTGSGSFYHSLLEKFVLELRLRTGMTSSYGDTDEVPVYERFYAGGAYTIRGYKERAVSPRDPGSNEPIGGEAILVGNAELTVPIFEKILKGAVFLDVGNTWRRYEDFATGNFRVGTGVGARVKSPIGPINLDYGYPLSDNYGDKKEGRFYFSVSHGF